jgi:hypothetical protein
MTAKKRSTPATWKDPDDAPELTEDFFKNADVYEGTKLKSKTRGRPKSATPKEPENCDWMPMCLLPCVPVAKAGRHESMMPCVHR